MIDLSDLKRKTEAATDAYATVSGMVTREYDAAVEEFRRAASPDVILALIARIEELEFRLKELEK